MTKQQHSRLNSIISQLHSPTTPVSVRTRCIFSLKAADSLQATQALEHALLHDASALIRHEIAYVLGQMSSNQSIPVLTRVLNNTHEDVMVRHEAAEALGAIADPVAKPVLQRYAEDERCAQEVRETCILALARMDCANRDVKSTYASIDPAPPAMDVNVDQLKQQLCTDPSLFNRYKAMFALRNVGGESAVLALCQGMMSEQNSALFRHEVAYVLGQMQHKAAIPALIKHLRDTTEHDMVRHEAAEALGNIGGNDVEEVLKEFVKDKSDAVRESVEVALDISDYVNSDDLHYAPTAGATA